jgi:hypothetical protein
MASCAKCQRKFLTPSYFFIVILLVLRNTCSESMICTIVPAASRVQPTGRVQTSKRPRL